VWEEDTMGFAFFIGSIVQIFHLLKIAKNKGTIFEVFRVLFAKVVVHSRVGTPAGRGAASKNQKKHVTQAPFFGVVITK
jgi:hypothetical protein